MAQQIKSITSESLESAYRALVPSQEGFTEDLMASNTIIPVLDLTANAGGGAVPEYQAQALAFGSQTAFDVANTTTTLANTAGFWRLIGTITSNADSPAANTVGSLQLSDGLSTKTVFQTRNRATTNNITAIVVPFDLVVFLRSGDSISAVAASSARIVGSYRQVADVNGVRVDPAGFTPQ